MTDKTGKAAPKGAREERLKQALRENLKRRKAQSRERSQTVMAEEGGVDEAAVDGPDDSKR
ncbi:MULTISPECIES: hypothetical protein [unclassified Bradyrhizobium]|uniref:hypothetical protein n=1 Tax=unclassified Bradyrhizobium TaxID=2631580 RepID=UPI0028E1A4E0|nr:MULTISPECIES: hypothetical protein [unclassified Bradyrhizobium]